MKSFKTFCLILCGLIGLSIGIERCYHSLTDGFTPSRALADQCYLDAQLMPSPSPAELQRIFPLLDQKFTYLGKGTQSFAFESADGSYVLKLYKHHRHRRGAWMQAFSAPPFDKWFQKKRLEQMRHFQETFYSFKLSFEELKQETGLVYTHFAGKTDLLRQKVQLIDKMGRGHFLDLDTLDFSLQKKGRLVRPVIQELMEKGDSEGAKRVLSTIVDLLKKRCEKGIGDRDPGLTYNLGITEEGPIFIDLGQFFRAPELKDKTVAQAKIYDVTGTLRDWLKIHYPELEAHVLREVEAIGF